MSIAQKPDEITVVVENEPEPEVAATGARVTEMMLYVALSDGREVGVPLSHQRLRWLKEATPEQRNRWEILPDGWAVHWPELDDGIEVRHLLSWTPL